MASDCALNRQRVFRDRSNPFDLPDHEIIARYRLPRAAILDICDLLQPDLERDTMRTNALAASTQVFATLRYLAGRGGGCKNKQNFVLLASEPVGGRSRATELPCFCVLLLLCAGSSAKE